MFIDASAIVAILAREAEADDLAGRLEAAPQRFTSAVAIYEAALALARLRAMSITDALTLVTRFVHAVGAEVTVIGGPEAAIALDAFERFGRGRHPAALNMGDCFAYACARALNAPLLYKGDDFSQTDLR